MINPIDFGNDKKLNDNMKVCISLIAGAASVTYEQNTDVTDADIQKWLGNAVRHIEIEIQNIENYNKIVDKKLEDKIKTTGDVVNHPSHYTDGKYETIDFIEDCHANFHLGNAIKYISRAGKKNPAKTIEDYRKAIWYINRDILRRRKENNGGDNNG